MNISSFELYALLSLCKLGTAAWFLAALSAAATGISGIMFAVEATSNFSDSNVQELKSIFKKSCIVCACSTALTCIIPSKTEMAAIVVLPAIVNSEAVQTIPSELTALATEWLKELHPKKSE